MIHAGLVLEGGGMRGMYTTGVLEFFLEKNLEFENCYGVSAGACQMCSYISKQPGRAYHAVMDYVGDPEYCSFKSLITTGNMFNVKMCYELIPDKYLPYDYKTAANYPGNAFAVATNIVTGEPEYLPVRELHHDITAIQASASLPLLSKNVHYNGKLLLDGGISDAIPVKHSIACGNQKNVVVLTKAVGYKRKPSSHLGLIKLAYLKYPKIYELMARRHIDYNDVLHYIEEEEKKGNLFVLRPQEPDDIGRIEKDKNKLDALYRKGYEDARVNYEKMMSYLND